MSERPAWARGAGAWSVRRVGDEVEGWVLYSRWPPVRAPFREDKGATTEETAIGPVRKSSPTAGAAKIQLMRRIAAAGKGKPAEVAMLRAPVAEVLKLVCGRCHLTCAFFITWQSAETVEAVLAQGRWIVSDLPSTCTCEWTSWPDARKFRKQLTTALGRGLTGGRAAVKVVCEPI